MIPRIDNQRDGTAHLRFPEPYLAKIYTIPNPYRTREAFDRFHHLDLPSLDPAELAREHRCAQRRLDYEPDAAAAAWLAERLAAVAVERTRRTWSGRAGEVRRIPHPPKDRDAANLPPNRLSTSPSIHVAGAVLDPPRRRPSRG